MPTFLLIDMSGPFIDKGLALFSPCGCLAPSTRCLKHHPPLHSLWTQESGGYPHHWDDQTVRTVILKAYDTKQWDRRIRLYNIFGLARLPRVDFSFMPLFQAWLCKHSGFTKSQTHGREGPYSDILLKSRLTHSVMLRAVRLKNRRGKLGRH